MARYVPFPMVLRLLESHGWRLGKIWKPYFVFTKAGELPILIPVHDKMVSEIYVEKIKRILGEQNERAEEG